MLIHMFSILFFYYIYTKLYICLIQPTCLFCFLRECLYQIQFQRKIFYCSCQFIIYKRILILLNFFICHVCLLVFQIMTKLTNRIPAKASFYVMIMFALICPTIVTTFKIVQMDLMKNHVMVCHCYIYIQFLHSRFFQPSVISDNPEILNQAFYYKIHTHKLFSSAVDAKGDNSYYIILS